MPKTAKEIDRDVEEYLAEESTARPRLRNPRSLTRAILDKAVSAAQLYYGSIGRVRFHDEQKLRTRMVKAIERVVSKSEGKIEYWNAELQVRDEAKKRGLRMAMAGKDI